MDTRQSTEFQGRLWKQAGLTKLEAACPDHADIVPGDGMRLEVWGVATTVIKSLIDLRGKPRRSGRERIVPSR